jgi:hypothetical protein
MPKNENCDLSDLVEHKDSLSVSLCSKAYLAEALLQRLTRQSIINYRFWSITFPRDYIINTRGKKKPFSLCSPYQQWDDIQYKLKTYEFEIREMYIMFEQNKDGNMHLHLITDDSLTIQHQKSNIAEALKFDTIKKFQDKININVRSIDNVYKAISYFMKDALDYVSNKNEACIDDFNMSIYKKHYEIYKQPFFMFKLYNN